MLHALVKLRDEAEPILMGAPNESHIKALATMDKVDWVLGPITGSIWDDVKYNFPAVPVPVTSGALSPLVMRKVKNFLIDQKTIQAIKEVRSAANWGLKEAKDFVDFLKANTDWYPPF